MCAPAWQHPGFGNFSSRRATMASSMDPLRCIGIRNAVLSTDGKTVLIEMIMDNGKLFPLELTAGGVELMSRAMFASSLALAEAEPTERALADTQTEQAVWVPLHEQASRTGADGRPQWLVRSGCLDLLIGAPPAAAPAA